MNIPYVMRKCTCCGRWLVASTDNFYRVKTGRYGLFGRCKKCISNRYKTKDNLVNTDPNITKVCTICGEEFPATQEYFYKNKAGKYGLDGRCKKCDNKKNKRYRQNNKEKEAERHKQYREANRDSMFEQQKQYRQSLQGQVLAFNRRQRRRTREEEQGTGITKDQWLEMMQYFDWRCAYSGERLTKDTRSIDHIVPLNSNGDNMIWNCVPMLRSLNSSKNSKDMLDWYKEQDFYDPKRLQKIYEWQEFAYNKYGKDTEYFNSGNIQIKLL